MDSRRIVILGAGHVGSHCACALAAEGVCEEIVLVDIVPGKAQAQALDVADSVSFSPRPVLVRAGDYADCEGAALIVVAIGEPRLPGQTRLDLLDRSVELIGALVAQLRSYPIRCPVVAITNPVDIVAELLRRSLMLERWRCFGTGTLLDTARLIRILARRAGVAPQSVSAFALGEHGDSSLVALSGALICQQQRYADLNCGNGMLVMGLASVIIGQVFFGRRGIVAGLIGAVSGSLLYRIVLQAAYKVNMPSYAVKLLSALIVVAALDPGAAEKVMAVTMEITAREHITTLMITHNMENALRAGSRTILLSGGRIELDLTGEARERMTSGALAEIFYGGRAR